jgi:hypothetical protein
MLHPNEPPGAHMKMRQFTLLFFAATALSLMFWFTFFAGIFFNIEAITNVLPASFAIPAFFLFGILIFIISATYLSITPAREKISHMLRQRERQMKFWNLETDTHFEMISGEKVLLPASLAVISARKFLSASLFARTIIITNKRVLIATATGFKGETFHTGALRSPLNLWHPATGGIPLVSKKPLSLVAFLGRDSRITGVKLHEVPIKQDNYDWDSVEFRVNFWIIPATFRIYSPKAREIYRIFSRPIEQ